MFFFLEIGFLYDLFFKDVFVRFCLNGIIGFLKFVYVVFNGCEELGLL